MGEQANSFSGLTAAFGKGFHTSSQKQSCKCVSKGSAEASHQKYLQAFLEEYDADEAGNDKVQGLLSKWKGKEGNLYAGLVKKYGHNFVKFTDIDPEFEEGSKHQEL